MREILFRGKKWTENEWVYGYLTQAQGFYTIQYEDYESYYCEEQIKPETVGQFTGLTDKNGKKIFEGDIIKTNEFGKDNGNGVNFNNFDIFEVIYSSASFKLNNNRRLFNMIKGQEFEVIGNIHDNPEHLGE